MSIAQALTFIQDSSLAHAISKSDHMVAASLQVIHVLGFIVLLAALVLISLRLLNVAFKWQALADVVRDATRLMWLGLTLAVVSGTLMFVATPKLYFYKFAFELKMLLFVGAVLIQFTLFRNMSRREPTSPVLARLVVGLSLGFWFGIGLAGRMIGFT
jgi:hypothetical protein